MMALLKLFRLPRALLALADMLAGFLIIRFAGIGDGNFQHLALLLLAGAMFAVAGSIWRDWFNWEQDRETQKSYPLATNEVSSTVAFLLGGALTVAALMLTMTVGYAAFYLAATLTLLLFANLAFLQKSALLAPLTRGAEPALLMLIGMCAHPRLIWLYADPTVYLPPLLLLLFVAAANVLRQWEFREIRETAIIDRAVDLATEIDSGNSAIPAPTATPAQWQTELHQHRVFRELNRQNRVDNFFRSTRFYIASPLGLKILLILFALIPVVAAIVLPRTLAAIAVAILPLAILGKPAMALWKSPTVDQLRATAEIALICESGFAAVIAAGFCRNFYADSFAAALVLAVALISVPCFFLRQYFAD